MDTEKTIVVLPNNYSIGFTTSGTNPTNTTVEITNSNVTSTSDNSHLLLPSNCNTVYAFGGDDVSSWKSAKEWSYSTVATTKLSIKSKGIIDDTRPALRFSVIFGNSGIFSNAATSILSGKGNGETLHFGTIYFSLNTI